MHLYHNIFHVSFFLRCGRKPECSSSQGSRWPRERRANCSLSARLYVCEVPSAPLLRPLARPNDAPSVASPSAASPFAVFSQHICISRHLPWIACVRVRAWAGHRPLPGNSSHLDSLHLISCDFFFFFFFTLELFFSSHTRTRDGCTRSWQACQEVDESKAGGPEKGNDAQKKTYFFASAALKLPSFISWCLCRYSKKERKKKTPTWLGFSRCPFVFTCQPWDVSWRLLENSRFFIFF